MKNIEIEIKIKLDERTTEFCKKYLADNCIFISSNREVDQYLIPSHRNFLIPEYPYEWLRLRQKTDKYTLNYKHWYPENTKNSTHCDEYETLISDPESLLKIFDALNIKPLIIVDKVREKFNYNDEFEISLDFINNLGYFLEIEYIGTSAVIEHVNLLLLEMAKTLKLNLENREHRGYPYLMIEQLNSTNKLNNDK